MPPRPPKTRGGSKKINGGLVEEVSELPFPGLLTVGRSVWGATYPGEVWALCLH